MNPVPKGPGWREVSPRLPRREKGALLYVDLASLRGVSVQFREIDEASAWKLAAGHLILGQPLRVGD